MTNILVKNIIWDTEGESLDEFNLPENVLFVNSKIDEENFALKLLDMFGCAVTKIEWEIVKADSMFCTRLAVIL